MSDKCWPPSQASYWLRLKPMLQAKALGVLHNLFPNDSTSLKSHSQIPHSPYWLCLPSNLDCLSHVLPVMLPWCLGLKFPILPSWSPPCLYLSCPLSSAQILAPWASLLEHRLSGIHQQTSPCYHTTHKPAGVSLRVWCCSHHKGRLPCREKYRLWSDSTLNLNLKVQPSTSSKPWTSCLSCLL